MQTKPGSQFFLCQGASDPQDDLASCQRAIRAAGWWKVLQRPEAWPLDTAAAAEMLSEAGQFDIDAEGLLILMQRGFLPPPAKNEAGGFDWDATDVIEATRVLENRQQFRPTPSQHDPKKPGHQLLLEQVRADGLVEEMLNATNGPRFDVRQLLVMLQICDNREGRQKIAALLKAVLEVEHGLFIP
jgi:hypothetical protein